MPLTIPAGDGIAAIRFFIDEDSEPMFCTLGVRALNPPLDATHAERVGTSFKSSLLNRLAANCKLHGVTLRVRQDGGGDLVYEYNLSPIAPGTQPAASLPPNVAVLIEKLTARAGKRGKGRMFVPGMDEADVSANGQLPAVELTAMQNAANSFYTLLTADPADPSAPGSAVIPLLFHGNASTTTRSSGGGVRTVTVTEGAAGPAPDVITAFQVDPKVGTQRRRLR